MANIPSFTSEEVSQHDHETSCWITHEGSVYDVTPFIKDHPGGREILLDNAGKDISLVMNSEHDHSKVAFAVLDKYRIGQLIGSSSIKESQSTNFTKLEGDPEFLDLERPLIWQMLFEKRYSKPYYLKQIHIGRYLNKSARLFGPDIIEVFSMTPWFVIPLVWFPISFLFGREAGKYYQGGSLVFIYCLGILWWTLLEYCFHRFLFHVDYLLPKNQFFFTIHFLLHGIHHFLPMDRYRLVMPPVLFGFLTFLVYSTLSLFTSYHLKCGLISGALTGYIAYDLLHYSFHHAKLPGRTFSFLKGYHLRHHYSNESKGFGVSSPLWDIVFGTKL
jgi:4-hydroxysphinganine ceramide fatty acyl 2-hydroxylase